MALAFDDGIWLECAPKDVRVCVEKEKPSATLRLQGPKVAAGLCGDAPRFLYYIENIHDYLLAKDASKPLSELD